MRFDRINARLMIVHYANKCHAVTASHTDRIDHILNTTMLNASDHICNADHSAFPIQLANVCASIEPRAAPGRCAPQRDATIKTITISILVAVIEFIN